MATLLQELEKHKNNREDGRVFGLVLQGGGMRAVYSAAALATLIGYDLSDAFDHVIGASAGAMNGAYFIAGQAEAVDVYKKDLITKDFVNLRRNDKRVDIDFLVDSVLKRKHPLNVQKLLRSPTTLHVVLTDAETGKKKVISNHRHFLKIYEELRATAAMPILYDKR